MLLLTILLFGDPDYMVKKLHIVKSISLTLCILNYMLYGTTMAAGTYDLDLQ